MNIKTALKRKNKLVGLIASEFLKISTYNSIIEGNERPYDIEKAIYEWDKYSKELVELKAKIHQANAPVFKKIFLISELKSQVKSLKGLNCDSGKSDVYSRYGSGNSETIKTAAIMVNEKDLMIKDIEAQIDQIQDELDDFNFKTEI